MCLLENKLWLETLWVTSAICVFTGTDVPLFPCCCLLTWKCQLRIVVHSVCGLFASLQRWCREDGNIHRNRCHDRHDARRAEGWRVWVRLQDTRAALTAHPDRCELETQQLHTCQPHDTTHFLTNEVCVHYPTLNHQSCTLPSVSVFNCLRVCSHPRCSTHSSTRPCSNTTSTGTRSWTCRLWKDICTNSTTPSQTATGSAWRKNLKWDKLTNGQRFDQ